MQLYTLILLLIEVQLQGKGINSIMEKDSMHKIPPIFPPNYLLGNFSISNANIRELLTMVYVI